ncbi:flagellar biosynthesis protein FlhB [Pseudodesulfovibrio tunisiensis]|uniref:flagellar biosynthesis protein FlhB n=1 Tax=Pseudodesulfovibrio tunisiensis TaxID=463192 RepID=UPI001FB52D63|nr:flagellar biosynthesis protein FlhB [Pseudodesulfovibrio tunisiensis]
MAERDPSKTEKATGKRRKKTRQDGNVPKSGEMSKVIVILAGVIIMRLLIGYFHEELSRIFRWAFSENLTNLEVDPSRAYSLFLWGIKEMAKLMLPILLFVAFVSWLSMRIQVGKLWTTKAMRPKFAQMFNITKALKKLLISPKAFVRLGRSILQAVAVGIAPYIVIKQEYPNFLPLFHASPEGIAAYILSLGYKMVCYALVPMLIIAIADIWYTRWDYEEKIKMTKDEVKDERKQAEGDPKIKAQQQRKMMEVMARRMMQDVPRADVIVTNPTHYAVALRYDALEAPAPVVLAKGVNNLAERIKEVARENNVPIEPNPPLARALYKQVEIGDTIPEELFQAVAALLSKLEKFKRPH